MDGTGMPSSSTRLVFCIPVFNDWESAELLLERLGEVSRCAGWEAGVLLVDDGSPVDRPAFGSTRLGPLRWVRVLQLRRNVGHQRAIALGLTHLQVQGGCDAVVVMDGDGEDRPADVPALVAEYNKRGGRVIVFAKRRRRTEGLVFLIGYRLYKGVHRLLTGRAVEVGNFSIIPAPILEQLVGVGEIWNHYAAAVYKARLPFAKVPIDRGLRLAGRSRMNFVNLVVHGLSAVSVFAEEIGTRLLLGCCGMMAATVAGLFAVLAVRLGTDWAIPGWATTAFGLLLVILSNTILLSIAFLILILQSRTSLTFIPLRDYHYFIHRVEQVYPNE